MAYPIDGILLIDKAEGETSYDVVRKMKRIFKGLKVDKFGHAGTLDPFATGLLIILVGQGTKLSSFIMSQRKRYLATVRLGIETDTLDPTGKVICERAVPKLSLEFIRSKAQGFSGNIEQTPPIYSAIKYKGTRAYKLAREGRTPTLKKRSVSIYSFDVTSVELPDVTMEVECSSGTYMRSLASDLGRELGPGGHLRSLRRLKCGPFNVNNTLKSQEISAENLQIILNENLIPLGSALPDMPEIIVGNSITGPVRHGRQSVLQSLADGLDPVPCEGDHFKLIENGELVAVVKSEKSGRDGHVRLEISRVFV